mgnify:CR=1 FL=1
MNHVYTHIDVKYYDGFLGYLTLLDRYLTGGELAFDLAVGFQVVLSKHHEYDQDRQDEQTDIGNEQ